MSIQQNFPGFSPSLNLNFARSKSLDQRVTFVRQTGATVTNELGLLERVGNNIPRFDHVYDASTRTVRSLGLLIEESRVNYALRSQEFNLSPNSAINASITPNAAIAPDGTLTADKLVEDNISSTYKRVQQGGFNVSGDYTVSFFVKEAGRYRGYIQLLNTTNASVSFNLQDVSASGVVPSRTKIEPYPNGWYRVSTSHTFNAGETPTVYIVMMNDAGQVTYTGDGSSGLYIWGLQVEPGSFPTSYIPTTALPTTRLADRATIDGQNFSSWYNQIEGTYFMSTKIAHTPNPTVSLLFRTAATGGPRVSLEQTTSNTLVGIVENIGAYFFSTSGSGLVPANQFRKTSLSYISTNGTTTVGAATNLSTLVDTASSTDVNKSMNTLYLGRYSDNAYYLNGHIQQFVYYPRKISNTQLQQLTR